MLPKFWTISLAERTKIERKLRRGKEGKHSGTLSLRGGTRSRKIKESNKISRGLIFLIATSKFMAFILLFPMR